MQNSIAHLCSQPFAETLHQDTCSADPLSAENAQPLVSHAAIRAELAVPPEPFIPAPAAELGWSRYLPIRKMTTEEYEIHQQRKAKREEYRYASELPGQITNGLPNLVHVMVTHTACYWLQKIFKQLMLVQYKLPAHLATLQLAMQRHAPEACIRRAALHQASPFAR